MRYIIEKEICNPKDGKIIGPYYHLYKHDGNGNKTLIETFEADIEEAAKKAERQMDLDALEIHYKDNPNSFSSIIPAKKIEHICDTCKFKNENPRCMTGVPCEEWQLRKNFKTI